MITIDLVHDYENKTEKPHLPTYRWLVPDSRPSEAIYQLAADRHQALLQAARQAHLASLAKKADEAAVVDVQPTRGAVERSRAKRVTRQIIELVSKNLVKGEG